MKHTPSDWEDKIRNGIIFREKFGGSDTWYRLRSYYRGKFGGNDILPYNITFSNARTFVSRLYYRNPYILVTPTWAFANPDLGLFAKIVEAVDNILFRLMGVRKHIKRSVLDCFLCGIGGWKIGMSREAGYTLDAKILSKYPYLKERIEFASDVAEDMPWWHRTDPVNIVVPYGTTDIDSAPWIAHRIIRPLYAVKQDPFYKNTSQLQPTKMGASLFKTEGEQLLYGEGKEEEYVELWEVFDKRSMMLFVIAPGHPQFLHADRNVLLEVDDFPFVFHHFADDPEWFWAPSPAKLMEPQQLELNEARTQAMKHRRIALLKFLVDEGLIKEEELEKLLSEDVGAAIRVPGLANTPNAVVTFQPHVPPDLIAWVEMILSDARELIGLGRNQRAEMSPGRRAATEVIEVAKASDIRISDPRDYLAAAIERAIQKVNRYMFSLWETPKVVEVVGYDAARYWVEFAPKALKSDYTVRVDVESMSPVSKSLRKREILELITALGKNPQVNLDYLMRTLVREYDWLDALSILPPAPETATAPIGMREFLGLQQRMLQNNRLLRGRVGQSRRAVEMAQLPPPPAGGEE